MRDDALYTFFPRWLEESGLPELLNREAGPEAWAVFRKLAEVEVEQNLLPEAFTLSRDDLARWTGLSGEQTEKVLERIEELGLIRRKRATSRPDTLRLKFPRALPVPLNQEEIAGRLAERGWQIDPAHWRYLAPPRLKKEERKVIHLYHQLFGARMNDRIAADLVAIARAFQYAEVEKIFQEAKNAKIRSFSWILNRLYQGVGDEGVPKTRRRTQRKKSAQRAETGGSSSR